MLFHDKRHPKDMGTAESRAFLASLARHAHGAASTQHGALNALLLLYRDVLQQPLPHLEPMERAKRPRRLPTVFPRDAVHTILTRLTGMPPAVIIPVAGTVEQPLRADTVTGCHDPTGGSQWHPVEQRLCSSSSRHWAGTPLRTWDTMLGAIRGTTTSTGLEAQAFLHAGVYETGQSVSDAEMEQHNLARHVVCPTWNSTIRPRLGGASDTSTKSANREVIF
jgi:hypothetical protein